MKKIIFKAIMVQLFISFPIASQAQSDSTMSEKVLKEVVVKSDIARTSAGKSAYLPTKKQRNAATDATALFQHMMIPQLRVSPGSGVITTISGEEVAIFIDFMPATKEDLAGMNTQDVKRVDIYEYPSDVRFQSKPHVVNFVMHKYEMGGYSKLTTSDKILSDFSSNNSIYSMLAYKNWTFNANATGLFSEQNHLGSETVETFNLPSQTISRIETLADGKLRNRQTSASFRATYQSQTMQLANRIEFLDNNTPK